MSRRWKSLAVAAAVTFGLLAAPRAEAAVVGGQLYTSGGTVTVTFQGSSAGFTSHLYLFEPLTTPQYLLATSDPLGTTATVGPFAPGTELVFGIIVQNTGDTFRMGPGSRNPDAIEHAGVDYLGPNLADVGFEDILGGGDLDYNDLTFRFEGGIFTEPPIRFGRGTVATVDVNAASEVVTVVDTGTVASESTASGQAVAATVAGGTVAGDALHALVRLDDPADEARTTTHADELTIYAGSHTVVVKGVETESVTTCDPGVLPSGRTTITFLSIDGVTYVDDTNTFGPNTLVPLLVGSLWINEQLPNSTGYTRGLTVNALHLNLPGVDVVVASSMTAAYCPN